MLWENFGARFRLRCCILSLAAIAAALAVTSDAAHARRHHRVYAHHRHHAQEAAYDPPYSSMVVDANSGAVLEAVNPDALRHPASLTKVMTLYLLFERLDAGRIKLDTPLAVSEHASEQDPTKLNLKPGQTITVEDAIKGIVTRSANDAAVVIAENLGGSEQAFAKLMTEKAHALGMTRTTYVNASGLPDDDQVTTARDQVLLGRAIQDRFPRYYKFFSTQEFEFRGTTIRGHNHLLSEVQGVDGIKTGFTLASGFNLLTSLHRDGRYLVAAVLGGPSASVRDARMRELIADHIPGGLAASHRADDRRRACTPQRADRVHEIVADHHQADGGVIRPACRSSGDRQRQQPGAGESGRSDQAGPGANDPVPDGTGANRIARAHADADSGRAAGAAKRAGAADASAAAGSGARAAPGDGGSPGSRDIAARSGHRRPARTAIASGKRTAESRRRSARAGRGSRNGDRTA